VRLCMMPSELLRVPYVANTVARNAPFVQLLHPTASHVARQIHLCYASSGPMALAATLIGSSGDCMQQQVRCLLHCALGRLCILLFMIYAHALAWRLSW